MTEHSKIPLPSEKDGKRKSLFERAEGLFGIDGYKPAPVPSELAPAPDKLVKRKAARAADAQAPEPAPVPEPPTAEQQVPREVEVAAPVAAKPSEPVPVEEPVAFPTTEHRINRNRLRELGMIVPGNPAGGLMEEFRIVKRQVLASALAGAGKGGAANAQRVLVSSPLPGEGKTFCAVNLALAIAAEKDSEVLLVDADFAKPSVPELLGLPKGPGLMDALTDASVKVEECVLATDVPGLFVLPAGRLTSSDSEYLASKRAPEVLARLTRGAPNRIVIFDSPPALAASPAAELAKQVGQTVLVARADSTGQSALEDALSLLSNCPDIKLLLNAANFSPSGRRFGTYYGYGG